MRGLLRALVFALGLCTKCTSFARLENALSNVVTGKKDLFNPMSQTIDKLHPLESVGLLASSPFFVRRLMRAPNGSFMVLECLSAELAHTLELKLFFQDCARELAHIKSDGIVEISEMGTLPDLGFYVLYPYYNGVKLDEVFQAQTCGEVELSAECAASIILQAASILAKTHEQNYPHTALHPEHIGVDAHGNVWITGFLEAALRRRFGFKANGGAKLDAPELREAKTVSYPSDVYALGAMLYRLITGKFQADEWEPQWMGMMMDLDQAMIPGEALSSAIAFFQRALAERPGQRFGSMEGFCEGLQKLIVELGTRKSPEIIADALLSLRNAKQVQSATIVEALAPTGAPQSAQQASPSKETRVITRNTGNMRSIAPDLRSGMQLSALDVLSHSRYQIMQELGAGGTGSVYKVLDTTLAEILALKVLRPELVSDSTWLHRFKRELKVMRDLDHDYILPAYHLEQLDGLYFFTMRYIDGQNLYQRLKAAPLPYRESIYILRCAALALREAHRQGVIHRDFKSANIMVEHETGHPYLMDFGIALSRENPGLTVAGQGIGTPFYMSPEQSRGDAITEQADIYSFGVVCYECFARALPFDGPTTIAIYTAQLSGVFRPLCEIDPSLPPALDELVKSCLQPDAAQRPKSMQEIIQTLDAIPRSLN